MDASAARQSRFDLWKAGIQMAPIQREWDSYDCEIRLIADEYNEHLRSTSGFRPLDWQIIKAIIWTETGARNPQWKIKPMQIGVKGDPGMDVVLSGQEGADLILPPLLKKRLSAVTIRNIPAHNLRAGVGYLLMKMAYYEYTSVTENEAPLMEVGVKAGDTLDKLAKTLGSTIDIMAKLNPDLKILRPGQVVKYQSGSVQKIITGWRPMTSIMIAQRYNGGGDRQYAIKLDIALDLVRKGKSALCS